MDKENNIVYVQTKKGIFKCYKSEQMHKPIYYPVESKTNGYIDYYDVIEILNIDDLYEQCKKQKEVIDKAIKLIKYNERYRNEAEVYQFVDIVSEILNPLQNILEQDETTNNAYLKEFEDWLKEVSE